ncbi:cyclic pyranopterin monophosphate synthase MoaC [Halanaerobium sp.]|jgi:hypothetical protein|uniref:cyclic pyranopterin monophosphate synthase MoaC n=1 Tax=Halanaerobium sp. TaxID=1895664 RepID=UPI000DE68B47|nr:cyclic pyranopterin monophosphate synthase MoaC [Halanaerobium sp.]PUU89975.1 MAG: molybdenum cofactor biosynthesis protein C [Halanaerobium sp.]
MSDKFNHIDEKGKVKMVDVSKKDITERKVIAVGEVKMKASTLKMIKRGYIVCLDRQQQVVNTHTADFNFDCSNFK